MGKERKNRDRIPTSLYFIAIIPDTHFQEEVIRIKESIKENYESEHALRSPAHITLYMPFKWRIDRENRIRNVLSEFADGRSSFTINLKNFGSFPRKVIYIGVQENDELARLQKDLIKTVAQNLKLPTGQYKGKAFHPHMTVAFRDLKPAMFHKAWHDYKDKNLSYTMEVNAISLLKHNGKTWDICNEFKF